MSLHQQTRKEFLLDLAKVTLGAVGFFIFVLSLCFLLYILQ